MPNFDLSHAPYFDDFDESKHFARILFKPAHPVQARELTQLQTIIQKQIERFGRHIFKEGSLVYGGQFDIDTNIPHIKINDLDELGNTVTPAEFKGLTILGRATGIRAIVLDGGKFDLNGTDQNVLFIRYLSGSVTSNTFIPGEIIETTNYIPGTNISAIVSDTNPSGNSSLFTIESGVIFSNNFFVSFEKQTAVLSPFTSSPTCRVGFSIDFSIITTADDLSLLDNSQGFLNYASPGADRLSINPVLTVLPVDATDELPEFVELFLIRDSVVQRQYDRPIYDVIGDEIAKRTYDESGDYCVRGMNVRIREHLDTGENEGYLKIEDGGDPTLLAVGIEPGLAYVKGYEINKLVTKYIPTRKSTDSVFVNSQLLSANVGNYILLKEIVGIPKLDSGEVVELYSAAEGRITNKISSATSPSGDLIGYAKVRGVRHVSGVLGTANAQIALYIYDISMTSGVFSSVKSVRIASPGNFFADTVLTDSKAIIAEQNFAIPLYNVGAPFVKTIRNENDLSDTTFTFHRSNHNLTMSTSGTFSITILTSNEIFPYGVTTLSSFDKLNIFVSVNEEATAVQTGTVSGISGTKTISGSNTVFTRLNVGDRIEISGVAGLYTVDSITNDTELVFIEDLAATISEASFNKIYLAGSYIDLNSKGSANGQNRSVVGTSSTNLLFNMNESFTVPVNVSASFFVSRSSAAEIKKILRPNRFVKINCSSIIDLAAPINLGISDVYSLRQIRKHSVAFINPTDGIDVTNNFIFDNGQRDEFYDHARITPKPGVILLETDHLLVEFDYFYPDFSSGVGYFSVDSYPIDDSEISSTTIMTHEIPKYISSIGNTFDLRDYLDFRQIKQNTASDSITIAGASSNPANSNLFIVSANGFRAPVPSTQISIDYSYYISRRDIIVLNRTGDFAVIEGQPAIHPVSPIIPESVMGIAKIFIPPYPSLASTYGRILGREDISCKSTKILFNRHTMRDIGVIKDRVSRLEYYSAISLLETQTKEMLVLDENGQDRFKNGFFVDGFINHSLGATENDDYRCSIDKKEKTLRPFFKMNSFPYKFESASSSNIQITGPLLTLPYTETLLLEQSKATSYRNIEQSVYRFIGNTSLFPDTDVWVDTNTVDHEIENNFYRNDEITNSFEGEWGAWENYVTGYRALIRPISFTNPHPEVVIGVYDTFKEAESATVDWNMSGKAKEYSGDPGWIAHLRVVQEIETESRSKISTATNIISEEIMDKEEFGEFVTDASLSTYIRPQSIKVISRGLKPITRFHIFFDGENMNSYLTPMLIPSSGPEFSTELLEEGANWVSNDYGELCGMLRIPANEKRFRVGTREVFITDSMTNSIDATSFAKSYFVAHGLIQQKQNTIISTKKTTYLPDDTTIEYETREIIKRDMAFISCMAYSFMVKAPAEEDGVFLTSVDVFIQSLHETLGVWFEIREMNSAGGITRTAVPYSEVWMRRDDPRLKISEDGTVPTNVNFECPVFLMNDTQYAFVIHTEGLNPDTYFWISRLGEQDIETGKQVTSRPLTGNVYTTNNNLNWDIVQDIDLKIRFNRASFTTGVTGLVSLGNKPTEFWQIEDPSFMFTLFGETILGSDVIGLSSVSGTDSIIEGDIIIGTTSGKSAEVLAIKDSKYYLSDYGFTLLEPFTVTGKDTTGIVQTKQRGSAILDSFDRRTQMMNLTNSNGLFVEGMKFIGSTSGVSSTIVSINSNIYSTINYQPSYLVFNNTSCNFWIKGFETQSQTMGSYIPISPRSDFDFSKEHQLLSRTTEILNNLNSPSSLSKAEMNTSSNWVSPVIDLARTHAVFVSNIINDDITGESSSSGGNLRNKYISKTVTLADGQDAEDLLVMVTAYCPPGITDKFPIKAWMKIKNYEDGDQFREKSWIELENTGESIFSSIANKYDFRAYTFRIPSEMMTGQYGEVQYSSNSNTFSGFKQFSVKLGLLGVDSARVPRVSELKIIALQM